MLGLYVHVPFCRQKCFYCNFFSVKYDQDLAYKYIDALARHSLNFKDISLSSVYIGGGTPSILSPQQIEKLLICINDSFNLSNLCEFTFELNPDSVTLEKLNILKSYKVNRLSIGLQSSDDRILKFLGRPNNFKQFCSAYNMIRHVGFDNISVDLIYGITEQTLKNWKDTLLNIIKFSPENLSLYPLSIEEDTPFYKNSIAINEDAQRNMYDFSVDFLEKNGYDHYEIANWSKSGKESFHNTNYWRNVEYIALGAGASGYLNRVRYKNISDIIKYIELINSKVSVEIDKEYIDDRLHSFEHIMLGLRLLKEGVSIEYFIDTNYKNILKKFINQKILLKQNNRVKFAKGYEMFFNKIVSEFIT